MILILSCSSDHTSTASAAHFGFWRSVPLMLGMQCMLLVACSVGGLITLYPTLHFTLKVAGSLYLLWLSWKIATAVIVSGAVWLVFGTVIGRLLKERPAWTLFNLSMGLLTAACVLLIWR